MKSFRWLLVLPLLGLPGLAYAQGQGSMGGMKMGGQNDTQPAQPATQDKPTAATIAGTWVGGPTDTAFVPTAGMEKSDTLILKADSSYAWTRTANGTSTKMMVNTQAPTNNKWKRLTSTNISWWGGPGYTMKLDGDKLTLASVRPDTTTKKKKYLAFTRTSK